MSDLKGRWLLLGEMGEGKVPLCLVDIIGDKGEQKQRQPGGKAVESSDR